MERSSLVPFNAFSFYLQPALFAKSLTLFVYLLLYFCSKRYSWKISPRFAVTMVGVLFGIGFFLRCLWVMVSPQSPPSPNSEDLIMIQLARDLAEDRGFVNSAGQATAVRPFAYPLLMSLVFRLLNAWNLHGLALPCIEILQGFFSALVIVLLFFLGRQMVHSGVGLAAALFWTFSPTSILSAKIILDEHLFILFWLGGIYYFIKDFKRPCWKSLMAGAFLTGIASQFRTFSFAMGAVVFILGVIYKRKLFPALSRTLVTQIIILTLAVPWAVRNYYRLGSPILYTSVIGTALYFGNNPNPNQVNNPLSQGGDPDYLLAETEVEQNAAGVRAAARWIKHHPGDFAVRFMSRILYLPSLHQKSWVVDDNFTTIAPHKVRPSEKIINLFHRLDQYYYASILTCVFLSLILLALPRTPSQDRAGLGWAFGAVLYYLFFIGLTLAHPKYRFAIEPLFYLCAAYAFRWISDPFETAVEHEKN